MEGIVAIVHEDGEVAQLINNVCSNRAFVIITHRELAAATAVSSLPPS